MRLLQCYFGVYFPDWEATWEIKTKLQFTTQDKNIILYVIKGQWKGDDYHPKYRNPRDSPIDLKYFSSIASTV